MKARVGVLSWESNKGKVSSIRMMVAVAGRGECCPRMIWIMIAKSFKRMAVKVHVPTNVMERAKGRKRTTFDSLWWKPCSWEKLSIHNSSFCCSKYLLLKPTPSVLSLHYRTMIMNQGPLGFIELFCWDCDKMFQVFTSPHTPSLSSWRFISSNTESSKLSGNHALEPTVTFFEIGPKLSHPSLHTLIMAGNSRQ